MDTYRIYRNPAGKVEAVKIGFSWFGFFFTWIYFFVKKLWVPGGALIATIIFLTVFLGFIENSRSVSDNAYYVASLAYYVLLMLVFVACGYNANALLEESLKKRGFERIADVQAESPDGAIAQHAKSAVAFVHIDGPRLSDSNDAEFEGERILENDAYKLFLLKKYRIEKNAVLDKFVACNKIFDNLPLAFAYFDELENSRNSRMEEGKR